MRALLFIAAFAAGTVGAQEPAVPMRHEAFAHGMINCGEMYVGLALLHPGSQAPAQILAQGRVYATAAREVAGDAFVEQETPVIRQLVLPYVAAVSKGDKRQVAAGLDRIKQVCDAKLAARPSSVR